MTELAKALHTLSEHYPILKVSPLQAAWIGVFTVSSAIYTPRIIAIRNNRAAARAVPVAPKPVLQETKPAVVPNPGAGMNGSQHPRPSKLGPEYESVFIPGANQWVDVPKSGWSQ